MRDQRLFNTLNFDVFCPTCETDSAILQQRLTDLESVGKVLKVNTYCENCHSNNSEFIPLSIKKNQVVKFFIKDKVDLGAKVIKSQVCTFRIPELGIELEPGPESQAEIIDVEGVLSNITLALECEYGSNKVSRDITRVRQGKKKVTLVLDDPMGVSRVIPRKNL